MDNVFSAFGSISSSDQLPGTYLSKLIETLVEEGIDPAQYLQKAGLRGIRDDVYWDEVPYQKYVNFAQAALGAGVPALAFRTGLKFSILDQGLVGYAIISSPTLGQAIKALGRYGELLGAGHVINEYLRVDGAHEAYTMECSLSSPVLRQFELEQHSAQFLHSVPSFMVHPGFGFTQINYSFSKPDHAEHIEALVPCPVSWDQPATELIFDSHWLDASMSSANDLIAGFCEQHSKQLLAQISSNERLSTRLKQRVRRYPTRIPTASEFASLNNISERTLQRRLSKEGASYHQIVQRERMSLAEELLAQTDRLIKDICFQLGYTEVPNIQRAFKLWSGMTPGQYRLQTRAQHARVS